MSIFQSSNKKSKTTFYANPTPETLKSGLRINFGHREGAQRALGLNQRHVIPAGWNFFFLKLTEL